MWVSTFHSSCVRILRKEIDRVGFKSNFSIYDAADSKRLMTLVLRDLELDPKRYQPNAVLHWVSDQKNELRDAEDAAKEARNSFEEAYAKAYTAYQRRLREANALDFDDLIMTTVHLLQAFPDVRENYRRRFRHVLVDEYQDTNHAQYSLIQQLCGQSFEELETEVAGERVEPSELMVVGDADQSIYAFRGADIRNIMDFEQDFPDATTILLEQNYRSTQTILTAANSVIGNNRGRKDKRLWTDAGDGRADRRLRLRRRARRGALRQPRRSTRSSTTAAYAPPTWPCSTAPTPSPASSRRCSSAPASPTRSSAGCASTSARRSATRWPTSGCWSTPPTRSRCAGCSTRPSAASASGPRPASRPSPSATGSRFWEALTRAAEAPGLATRSLKNIEAFVAMVQEIQSMVEADERPDVILESVLERSGYLTELEASEDPQDGTRLENLAELVAVAREFAEDPQPGPSADPAEVEAGTVAGRARRLPRAGGAGGRRRPDPRRPRRRRLRRGHPDDAPHRQGPGVPGGLPHRSRGRRLPAPAVAGRPARARGGAPAGLRRRHPRREAPLRLPRARPLGVGRPEPQPGQPVPRRAARRPRRLAAYGRRADALGTARPRRRSRPPRHAHRRRAPQLLLGRDARRRRRQVQARPRRSRASRPATGSCTTRSAWAPSWRSTGSPRSRSPRSTSAPRASSALLLRYAPVEKL